MAVSAFSAARRICEHSRWTLSNLALQKIMYLSHMVYMGNNQGARLIDASFEAWDYGPVEPSTYHKAKVFGSLPVQDVFFSAEDISGSSEAAVIDDACEFLVGKRAAELVAMTHWERGAWAKNYFPGRKRIFIPDADIIAEYNARAS